MPRGRRLWWAGGGLFVSAACLLGVAGGVVPVVVFLAALPVGAVVRAAWVLRRRGVVAEGRLESSYAETVEDVVVRRYVYAYSDARGERRTCTGTDVRGDAWAPILYDPADPDGSSQVGTGTAGMLAFGAVLLLVFGIPVAAGAVAVLLAVVLAVV
ncbi:hypothetical protein [Streptomyces sp. NPDC004546]|uniref:hypothetical protein n=1 Tax=unclassified Streptomyces TaxID=2593676 RepID=UPI0033A35E18